MIDQTECGDVPDHASLASAENKKAPRKTAGLLFESVKRISVLCRPGSDLLFQVLRLSTIGAEDFDGRVRDGIG
jgi:hypothetical protein